MKTFIYLCLSFLIIPFSFEYCEAPNAKLEVEYIFHTAERIHYKIEGMKEEGLWNDKHILDMARGNFSYTRANVVLR